METSPKKRNYFVWTIGIALALGIAAYFYKSYSEPTPEVVGRIVEDTVSPWTSPPPPPAIKSPAYVLMDTASGTVLAEQNADQKMSPASLTKMMTLYVISQSLQSGQLHLDDMVLISKKAWQQEGSKLFVKVGDKVSVETLLKGIIIASGNDACVAMAEHIAGSEEGFSALMNQAAQKLGLQNTHFTNSTGLEMDQHYSTARDLAILASALIRDFPEHYDWYREKYIKYNGIKQSNRNRSLWHDDTIDGVKTGHTETAGFCVVSSAQRNTMRLTSVILHSDSDDQRFVDSEALLNWGFRFFESRLLYPAKKAISHQRVWKGESTEVDLGVAQSFYLTSTKGQYKTLQATVKLAHPLLAPIVKGTVYGTLVILNEKGEAVATAPLVALDDVEAGGIWPNLRDQIALLFQ